MDIGISEIGIATVTRSGGMKIQRVPAVVRGALGIRPFFVEVVTKDRWVAVHVPTGLALCDFYSVEDAAGYIEELTPMLDWETVTADQKTYGHISQEIVKIAVRHGGEAHWADGEIPPPEPAESKVGAR